MMETLLAFCRFAHFASAMALFGSIAFVVALAPGNLALALAPAVRRIAAVAIPIAAVSAVGWLALEGGSMTDSWGGAIDLGVLQGVLTDTDFGWVWQGRLLLALALVVALALRRHGPTPLTLASGLLLASLGLVGHAAMQPGTLGALHRANHAVHLLATAAWVGGVPIFVLCLKAFGNPDLRADAIRAMRRFSFWGQFDVALVVLTGVVNIALTSGFGALAPTTPYRALLEMKLALVAMMIAIALVNRYVLAPRLKSSAAGSRTLIKTSVAEVALGGAVVALVSAFALLDPF
ncbi:MAG: copper homeostasis membrane protein CopD [Hyphomicrobiales bacterium]|nr:copper homeostasis membrane protein CopD [Hyphomicrobiales bacterium]MBV8662923.1 copper homeostasis membrane protein CopD [Hyphomicrobiales bacterium]